MGLRYTNEQSRLSRRHQLRVHSCGEGGGAGEGAGAAAGAARARGSAGARDCSAVLQVVDRALGNGAHLWIVVVAGEA